MKLRTDDCCRVYTSLEASTKVRILFALCFTQARPSMIMQSSQSAKKCPPLHALRSVQTKM